MSKEKKHEVAKRDDTGSALARATDIAAYGVTGPVAPGTENIRPEDIELPRLRLIQGLSKECADYSPQDPEYRAIGTIVHSTTGEVVLPFPNPEPLTLIPLAMYRARIWFQDGQLVARSHDGIHHAKESPPRSDGITECAKCPDALWGSNGEPPKCGVQYVFPALIKSKVESGDLDEGLVAFLLAKTSAKEAKKLATMVKLSRLPFYSFPIEISTEKTKNDKGTFAIYRVKKLPKMLPDDALFVLARDVYEMIRHANVTVEVDDSMGEDFFGSEVNASESGGDDIPPF